MSALVLFAKAIHWAGLPNKPVITRIMRSTFVVAALAFVPGSIMWTQAKRGDRPWTAFKRPVKITPVQPSVMPAPGPSKTNEISSTTDANKASGLSVPNTARNTERGHAELRIIRASLLPVEHSETKLRSIAVNFFFNNFGSVKSIASGHAETLIFSPVELKQEEIAGLMSKLVDHSVDLLEPPIDELMPRARMEDFLPFRLPKQTQNWLRLPNITLTLSMARCECIFWLSYNIGMNLWVLHQ